MDGRFNPVREKETLLTGMTRDGTFLIEDGEITRALRDGPTAALNTRRQPHAATQHGAGALVAAIETYLTANNQHPSCGPRPPSRS